MKIANEIIFEQVKEIIDNGSQVEITITGNSMRPLLLSGRDTLVFAPICKGDIKVGAVVLFKYKGRHIVHRIIAVDGDNLTIAGDGNYKVYEYCSVNDIVAIVDSIIKKSGKRVKCNSTCWLFMSQLWVSTPAIIRRYTLAVLWRLGYK